MPAEPTPSARLREAAALLRERAEPLAEPLAALLDEFARRAVLLDEFPRRAPASPSADVFALALADQIRESAPMPPERLAEIRDWLGDTRSGTSRLPDILMAEVDRLTAERDAARAELAPWRRECDAVGIPHDPAGLIRHHRGNAALAAACDSAAAVDAAEADTRAARAELAEVRAALIKAEPKADDSTYPESAGYGRVPTVEIVRQLAAMRDAHRTSWGRCHERHMTAEAELATLRERVLELADRDGMEESARAYFAADYMPPGGDGPEPARVAGVAYRAGWQRAVRHVRAAASVIHQCPPDGGSTVPCCDRTPFEVPRTDCLTADLSAVTCRTVHSGLSGGLPPADFREWAEDVNSADGNASGLEPAEESTDA